MTPIREAQKNLTRDRIMDAAIELMSEGKPDLLTIAAVAERAGVTHRTIYRHFKSREALLEALWPRMQARVQSKGFPRTADALIASPAGLFPRFDDHANLVRASAFSAAGLEIRLRANAERQAAMLSCVRDALPDLDDAVSRRRAAIVQLINSAYGWSVLRDFWDLDGQQSGLAAAEAIAILLGRMPPASADIPHYLEERSE